MCVFVKMPPVFLRFIYTVCDQFHVGVFTLVPPLQVSRSLHTVAMTLNCGWVRSYFLQGSWMEPSRKCSFPQQEVLCVQSLSWLRQKSHPFRVVPLLISHASLCPCTEINATLLPSCDVWMTAWPQWRDRTEPNFHLICCDRSLSCLSDLTQRGAFVCFFTLLGLAAPQHKTADSSGCCSLPTPLSSSLFFSSRQALTLGTPKDSRSF